MTFAAPLQAKLEAVRQKVIAANPEITDLKIGCRIKRDADGAVCIVTMDHDFAAALVSYWHPTVKNPASLLESEFEILGRPIRLADVCLALMKAGCYFSFNHNFILRAAKEAGGPNWEAEWDCENDSLDSQSEEMILFLHSLLCQ